MRTSLAQISLVAGRFRWENLAESGAALYYCVSILSVQSEAQPPLEGAPSLVPGTDSEPYPARTSRAQPTITIIQYTEAVRYLTFSWAATALRVRASAASVMRVCSANLSSKSWMRRWSARLNTGICN
eukprot:SAG25_NODE_228_length_11469_cov_7.729903_8_plen_128_part_00